VTAKPQESDVTPDGSRLFVVHHPTQVVSVIDIATNTVSQVVPIGDPPAEGKTATDIAFTPNGRYALVPNYAKNVLDCIDTRTYQVTDVPTGLQPRRVAVMPGGTGQRAFVANFVSDSVTAVDTRRLTAVGTVPAGDEARGIAVNPQANQVAVTNVFGGSITFFDPNTLTVTGTLPVGHKPWNLIYNRDGSLVIVSNSGNDTITVIDTATLTVIKTVDCHNGPFFSVFNDDETKLYVSCAGPLNPPFPPGFVDIVDTATYDVIGSTEIQLQPFDETFVNPF
jgi:YVTN family beta-propeller protein